VNKPKPWVKYELIEENAGRFVISPLKRGMGITLGNSLRRVLLSSLTGIAITAIRMDGVDHEFSVVPNIKEDVLDIICNLKGVVFKGDLTAVKHLKLVFKDKKKLYAKDIKCDSDLEVVNKDHFIAEVTGAVNKDMELVVEKGIGYSSSENNKKPNQPVDMINIDATFSPILRVNHQVDTVRVGKELDYESLTLEVWTNGSVMAADAVKEASTILKNHVGLFEELNKKPEILPKEEINQEEEQNKRESALALTIDDLELSARSSNCLKRAGIEKVGQLIEKDIDELIKIKNFGKKSADEINEKLKQYGLSLKMEQNDTAKEAVAIEA